MIIYQEDPKIVKQAKAVINGNEPPTKKLAKALKKEKYFSYAREIFQRLKGSASIKEQKRLEEMAMCTYKDPDLPSATKYDEALNYLTDINETRSQERLGIAGAIYKRKWAYNGQIQNLEYALHYYKKGYELWGKDGVDDDDGYTAINAAYVMDLLAHQKFNEREKLGIEMEPIIFSLVIAYSITKVFGSRVATLFGWTKPEGIIKKKLIGVGVATLLFGISRVYLTYFNQKYLNSGKMEKEE